MIGSPPPISMNWTGGQRRRHAHEGKANNVLQKQKKHFAKARAAVHTTPNSSHRSPVSSSRSCQPISQCQSPTNHCHISTSVALHAPEMKSSHKAHGAINSTQSRLRFQTLSYASASPQLCKANVPSLHLEVLANHSSSSDTNQEERLLMRNRQRLLARSDWLGLAASRPAPYRFPSSGDKYRVAKRRKIDHGKPFRLHYAPHARSRTPAPVKKINSDPSLVPHGPLHDHDIQIKIGTDAFASQTHPSHHSRTVVNTSMRQPSTDFDSLSEEPMLLGVDADGFETIDGKNSYLFSEIHHEQEQEGHNLSDISRCPSFENGNYALASTPHHIPFEGDAFDFQFNGSPDLSDNIDRDGDKRDVHDSPICQAVPVNTGGSESDEDDEAFWRRITKLEKYDSGNSMSALASSTQPRSFFTNSAWQPVNGLIAEPELTAQGRSLEKTSSMPRDEELWRHFVIGSQDSDELPSVLSLDNPTKQTRPSNEVHSAPNMSRQVRTEQLCSDKATIGDTLYRGLSDRINKGSSCDPTQHSPHTSLIGHAATTAYASVRDIDSSESRTYERGNMRTSLVKPLTRQKPIERLEMRTLRNSFRKKDSFLGPWRV